MFRTGKRRWLRAWVVGGLVCLAACKVEEPTVAKPAVAETTVAKPTVAKPTVVESSVAKPAVAKPPVAKPTVVATAERNHATELLKHAKGIERIELMRSRGGHEVVATIDAFWVPRLKAQLVGADVRDDLTNTPPAWKLGVLLFVEGVDGPYVGLPVGYDRLRLNPHDPWSARIALDDGSIDPEILEVVVGETFIEHIDTLAFAAHEPRGKEHRRRP